jgi:hypothetical protein
MSGGSVTSPGEVRQNAAVTVATVGRSAVSQGKRRAEKQKRPSSLPYHSLLVLGAIGSGLAWFYLVRAAIDFGRLARDGDTPAWGFTVAATLGATVCLLLLFVLVSRMLVRVGLMNEYRPRRSNGRRAAR